MKHLVAVPAVLLALIGSSCSSPPADAVRVRDRSDLPTIQQAERARLEKIQPGMPVEDLRSIFPEIYPVALDDQTQALELVRVIKYVDDLDASWSSKVFAGGSRSSVDRQILWFYVVKGKLIKWGNPRDWPSKQEIGRFF